MRKMSQWCIDLNHNICTSIGLKKINKICDVTKRCFLKTKYVYKVSLLLQPLLCCINIQRHSFNNKHLSLDICFLPICLRTASIIKNQSNFLGANWEKQFNYSCETIDLSSSTSPMMSYDMGRF